MIITVLSRDKISQNLFRENIQNISDFILVGTHSNQDERSLQERIAFAQSQPKDVIIFHALKRSIFAIDKDWQPEPTADYPKSLWESSDAIIYTPTLYQSSYGKTPAVIKGDHSKLIFKQPIA